MARSKNRISDWLVVYLQDANIYTPSVVTPAVVFGIDYEEGSTTAVDCYLNTRLNEVLGAVQDEMEEYLEGGSPEDGMLAIVYEGMLGGTLTPVAVVRPTVRVSTTMAEGGED
jgi:hypothetical protein